MRRRLGSIELFSGLMFLSVTLPAPAALAAPFCLQSQAIPPQCIYDDPVICQRDATRQGGACVANPQQTREVVGTAPFCVASASGYDYCNYQDVVSCVRAATQQRGACVAAPPQTPATPQPTPRQLQAG